MRTPVRPTRTLVLISGHRSVYPSGHLSCHPDIGPYTHPDTCPAHPRSLPSPRTTPRSTDPPYTFFADLPAPHQQQALSHPACSPPVGVPPGTLGQHTSRRSPGPLSLLPPALACTPTPRRWAPRRVFPETTVPTTTDAPGAAAPAKRSPPPTWVGPRRRWATSRTCVRVHPPRRAGTLQPSRAAVPPHTSRKPRSERLGPPIDPLAGAIDPLPGRAPSDPPVADGGTTAHEPKAQIREARPPNRPPREGNRPPNRPPAVGNRPPNRPREGGLSTPARGGFRLSPHAGGVAE